MARPVQLHHPAAATNNVLAVYVCTCDSANVDEFGAEKAPEYLEGDLHLNVNVRLT
jgi:hypothetical protein